MHYLNTMKKLALSIVAALALTAANLFASGNCISSVTYLPPYSNVDGTPSWSLLNDMEWHTPAGGTVSYVQSAHPYYVINAPISNDACSYDLLFNDTVWFYFQTQNPCASQPTYIGTLYWEKWNGFMYVNYSLPVYLPALTDSMDVAIVQTPAWCNTCPCSQVALSVCIFPIHSCTLQQ